MEKSQPKYYISQLISKLIVDELSEEENKKLHDWLEESEENVLLFQKIKEGKARFQRDKFVNSLDVKSAWNKVNKEIVPQKKIIKLKEWGLRIAAVLIIGILVSTLFYVSTKDFDHSIELAEVKIQPGSSKAVLQMHNGEIMQLENVSSDSITEKDGTLISNQNGKLAYTSKKEESLQTIYNKVVVPIGGEYQLTLADGTKVWLNSDSEIRYPVQFNQEKRKVWIAGEVYFDVAHDKSKPFVVDVKDVEVEVLGTEFNVEAYANMNSVVTTLVDGSVKLRKETESIIIKPNQQASISTNKEKFTVNTVDAKNYSLWKDGIFYFEEASLNTIMAKLERWYGVKVFFMNQTISEKRFSIEVKRYEEIENVLNILSRTDKVHFDIDENIIVVRN